MKMVSLVTALGLWFSASPGIGEIVVHAPGYEQPVLYYSDPGLIPDKMHFGFDGHLYVGNDKVDLTPVSIHRVTAAHTGGPYGDGLLDPDVVLQTADGYVYVGGNHDVWRIPPGPGTPELVIDGLFDLPHQPGHFALAPNGDILANNNDTIVRVQLDGTLTTVIENVPTTRGIAFDNDGYLYFVDENRTGISRVFYDPGAIPYDGSTITPFITGFSSMLGVDVLDDGTIMFVEQLEDEVYFGYLDGTTLLFATVPRIGGGPDDHSFSAIEGPDGAIYLADGIEGEEAIFRIVPEPTALCLLALGGLAVMRRRR